MYCATRWKSKPSKAARKLSRFRKIVSHDRPDWNPSRQIFRKAGNRQRQEHPIPCHDKQDNRVTRPARSNASFHRRRRSDRFCLSDIAHCSASQVSSIINYVAQPDTNHNFNWKGRQAKHATKIYLYDSIPAHNPHTSMRVTLLTADVRSCNGQLRHKDFQAQRYGSGL